MSSPYTLLAVRRLTNPLVSRTNVAFYFSDCCPFSWFQLTEETILDLLEGSRGAEYLLLVIGKFGDKIVITDRILAAVASLPLHSEECLQSLRYLRPQDFVLTPWILEKVAAGGNVHQVKQLMQQSQGTFTMNEKWERLSHSCSTAVFESTKKLRTVWAADHAADVPDAHEHTILHAVVKEYGNPPQTVRFLLDTVHANFHAVDRGGQTPLHYAVRYCRLEIILILLAAGADPHKAALNGETAISCVEAEWGSHTVEDQNLLFPLLKDEWFAEFWCIFLKTGEDDTDNEDGSYKRH